MKKQFLSLKTLMALCLISIFTLSCKNDDDNTGGNPQDNTEETVVVANRAGGSIIFIDAKKDAIIKTLSATDFEPMYVVYVPNNDRIYVGDRTGNKVHVVNPETKEFESTIDVGNGVFHMWADGNGKELWVNNDVDNTISVIDIATNAVVETIDIGEKPHDVFLSQDGTKAYVSILDGTNRSQDKIFMYSTTDYSKTGETSVGKDPHLFHLANTNTLYVPSQGSGKLFVLNGDDLSEINQADYQGAHGIFGSRDQSKIYATNISGSALYSIDAENTDKSSSIATTNATPHNIVVNNDNTKLYVTHSGDTSDDVTVYTIDANNEISETVVSLKVGLNPFGLAYYKREK
ncbi:YncE family protein [uncultured Algibacter sp.]|uniref:YncE family protein n=1 Tax=uncultured Algibacter sp. TaxID=298659 RepID=UPI0032180019